MSIALLPEGYGDFCGDVGGAALFLCECSFDARRAAIAAAQIRLWPILMPSLTPVASLLHLYCHRLPPDS